MFTNSNLINHINSFIPRQNTAATLTFIGCCHLLYHVSHWFFDYVLYIYVVYNWGMLLGGGIMMALSFLLCAITLSVYERMQIDFMGIGALQEWQTKNAKTLSGRLFSHINKNKTAVFIFLCVFGDPFILTAYFKQGRFNGLIFQDWLLLVLSALCCNLYWIAATAFLSHGTMNLWQWIILHADYGNGWLFEHTIVMLDRLQTLWDQVLVHVDLYLTTISHG